MNRILSAVFFALVVADGALGLLYGWILMFCDKPQ